MDSRVEYSEFKLNVVRWALHGMVEGGIPPTMEDLNDVLIAVTDIRKELREGIEETYKKYKKPRLRQVRKEEFIEGRETEGEE